MLTTANCEKKYGENIPSHYFRQALARISPKKTVHYVENLAGIHPIRDLARQCTARRPDLSIAHLSDCSTYRAYFILRNHETSALGKITFLLRLLKYFILEAYVAIFYHTIVLQTDSDQKIFQKIFGRITRAKLIALKNPAPLGTISLPNKDSKGEAALKILFVGQIDIIYANNLAKLISVLDRTISSQPVILRVVGQEILELHATTTNAGFRVERLGYVEVLRNQYSWADVCVSPSFKPFGFINKIQEALQYGKAIITDDEALQGYNSDVHQFPEVVISVKSIEEMAEALIKFEKPALQRVETLCRALQEKNSVSHYENSVRSILR